MCPVSNARPAGSIDCWMSRAIDSSLSSFCRALAICPISRICPLIESRAASNARAITPTSSSRCTQGMAWSNSPWLKWCALSVSFSIGSASALL